MARVTIEDCIQEVPNRFELVIVAAQRTRQIYAGAPINIKRGNDKYPVVALREIAEKAVDVDQLREAMVKNYRRHLELDQSEQEMADMLSQEQGFDRGSLEIGGMAFDEILTEEELAKSFKEDMAGEDLIEEFEEEDIDEDEMLDEAESLEEEGMLGDDLEADEDEE